MLKVVDDAIVQLEETLATLEQMMEENKKTITPIYQERFHEAFIRIGRLGFLFKHKFGS